MKKTPYNWDWNAIEVSEEQKKYQREAQRLSYLVNKDIISDSISKIDNVLDNINSMENEEMKKSINEIVSNNITYPEYLRDTTIVWMIDSAKKALVSSEFGFHSNVYIDVMMNLRASSKNLFDMLRYEQKIWHDYENNSDSPLFELEKQVNEIISNMRSKVQANESEGLFVLDQEQYHQDLETIDWFKSKANQEYDKQSENTSWALSQALLN